MNNKQAKKIIDNYKPHKGFFDLSKKPNTVSDMEYAKILDTQNYLAVENNKMKDKQVREANRRHWESLKVLSAELQGIIFQNWNLCELN